MKPDHTKLIARAKEEMNHLSTYNEKLYLAFNPHNEPIANLPVIYGFNNSSNYEPSRGDWFAMLIAQDGTVLGTHICSNEGFMCGDLGVTIGRESRHEIFQKHYPNGYRMDFVGFGHVETHEGLQAAFKASNAEVMVVK